MIMICFFCLTGFSSTQKKTRSPSRGLGRPRNNNPTWNEEVQVPFSMPAWDLTSEMGGNGSPGGVFLE